MSFRRPDGRSLDALRHTSISFDGLDRVDGSARFGFGETKALASVSGPVEVRLVAELASMATFEVIVRPLAGIAGTEPKSLSASIRSVLVPSLILTQNPRTLVQLVVQSLSPSPQSSISSSQLRTNPSLTASLINASSLAFLNAASVPMQGVVCAVGIGRLRSTREIILDPSDEELSMLDAGGVFAFLFSSINHGHEQAQKQDLKSKLVWSSFIAAPSAFIESELVSAQNLAQKGAERIWHLMKKAVGDLTSVEIQGRSLHIGSSAKENIHARTKRTKGEENGMVEDEELMEI